jgi:hypothetical protein
MYPMDQMGPYDGYRGPDSGQPSISKKRFEDISEIPKYSELDISVERSLLFTDRSNFTRDGLEGGHDTTKRIAQKKMNRDKKIEQLDNDYSKNQSLNDSLSRP